jgi:hypothetical protein
MLASNITSNPFALPPSPYGAAPRQAESPAGLSQQEMALYQAMQQQGGLPPQSGAPGRPQAPSPPTNPFARSASEEMLLQALKQGGYSQLDNTATFKEEKDRAASLDGAGVISGMITFNTIENHFEGIANKSVRNIIGTFESQGYRVIETSADIATAPNFKPPNTDWIDDFLKNGGKLEEVVLNGETYKIAVDPKSSLWQRLQAVGRGGLKSRDAMKLSQSFSKVGKLKGQYVQHYLKNNTQRPWWKPWQKPDTTTLQNAEAYAQAKIEAARAHKVQELVTKNNLNLEDATKELLEENVRTTQNSLDDAVKGANGVTSNAVKKGNAWTWLQRKLGFAKGEGGLNRQLAGVGDELAEHAAQGAIKEASKTAINSSNEVASGVGKAIGKAAVDNADDAAKAAAQAGGWLANMGPLGKPLKFLGEKAPLIGFAIESGFAAKSASEGNHKQAVKGMVDGAVVGNAICSAGFFVGAAIGGTVGSVVPVVGTGIGTFIGGMAGAFFASTINKSAAGQVGAGVGAAVGTALIPVPVLGTAIGALAGGAIGSVVNHFLPPGMKDKTLGDATAALVGATDKAEREGKQGEKQVQHLQQQIQSQAVAPPSYVAPPQFQGATPSYG